MSELLSNRLRPITDAFGFVEAPRERVVDELCTWQDRLFADRGGRLSCSNVEQPLEHALLTLLPLTTVRPRRYLVLETAGAWCAFFDSGARGTDPAAIAQLALRLKTRSLRFVCRGGLSGKRSTLFELFGPEPSPILNTLRSVAAIHDGDRWVFEQTGTPLPFEDLGRFEARAVRDRFGPADLAHDLRGVGIDAFDAAFYRPLGTLCTLTHPPPPALRELTLREAQERC